MHEYSLVEALVRRVEAEARKRQALAVHGLSVRVGELAGVDAELVHRSLHDFDWKATDVFFIENVGNLVCPAIYDLGQAANVVVLSVTEGEDKPLKYPVMFRAADLVLLTKCDLVPHLDVDLPKVHDALARVMPRPRVIEVSARTGQGMDAWIAWLEELRAPLAAAPRRKGASHAHGHEHPHVHSHEHEHTHDGEPHGHPHAHEHSHAHEHTGDGQGEHAHGDHGHAHGGGAKHDHEH